jgi:hypothetical protein
MLDDLQWADAATLGALSTLPRRLAAHRIMWLLAMRPYEHARPADAAIRRIESSAMVSVTLGGLDDGAVAAVAHDIIGACPDRGLLDQLAGVRGNPFLVAELLRGLREEDLITIEGGQARLAGRQIPRRFRDSVSWQLGRLSPRARDVLQMAAVLSRRFAVDELATLLEQPPQALIAPLHEVLAAGLMVEDGDRLAFRHDLVREAVDASLPAAMRIAMRRRAIETVLHHGAEVPSGRRDCSALAAGSLEGPDPDLSRPPGRGVRAHRRGRGRGPASWHPGQRPSLVDASLPRSAQLRAARRRPRGSRGHPGDVR